MIQEPLPQELETELRSELTAGERLLWSGRPKAGLIFRMGDWFSLIFGILWLGFVVFWMYSAAQSGAPIFFLLFGIPFFLVGLFLTGGRFLWDAFQRKKMVYAITSQRVMVLQGINNKSIHSLTLRSLPEIVLTTRSDGSGSIYFGQMASYSRYFRTSGRMGSFGLTTFENIPNVRNVHEILLRAQREVVDYIPERT